MAPCKHYWRILNHGPEKTGEYFSMRRQVTFYCAYCLETTIKDVVIDEVTGDQLENLKKSMGKV